MSAMMDIVSKAYDPADIWLHYNGKDIADKAKQATAILRGGRAIRVSLVFSKGSKGPSLPLLMKFAEMIGAHGEAKHPRVDGDDVVMEVTPHPPPTPGLALRPEERSSWSIVGTGLVGSNLLRKLRSEPIANVRKYSRRGPGWIRAGVEGPDRHNPDVIKGHKHGTLVVCAATSAKREVNSLPHSDMEGLQRLVEDVEGADFERLVLVSTIDAGDPGTPYGKNRLWLENVMRDVGCTAVFRLPSVFGHGLSKNILFDLLSGKMYGPVNTEDVHQWYDLSRLADDIAMRGEGLHELYPVPMGNDELLSMLPFDNDKKIGPPKAVRDKSMVTLGIGNDHPYSNWHWSQVTSPENAVVYDVAPKDGYLYGKDEVKSRLQKFIDSWSR